MAYCIVIQTLNKTETGVYHLWGTIGGEGELGQIIHQKLVSAHRIFQPKREVLSFILELCLISYIIILILIIILIFIAPCNIVAHKQTTKRTKSNK